MKKKKKLAVLTFILLVVALMTACTVSEPAPKPNEEISAPEEALPIESEPDLPAATRTVESELDLPAATHTIEAAKETKETAVPDDTASSENNEVSWSEALEILNQGDVKLVSQLHNLEVSLVLNDGRTVTTVEPTIDAIFDAVAKCGENCSNVVLMTE